MENVSRSHKTSDGVVRKTKELTVVSIEWEIADFKMFPMRRHGDMVAESPTFGMRDDTWKIRMFNNDSGPEEYKPTVLIELLQRSPEVECSSFICHMMIQINNDEICAGRTKNYRLCKGIMYFPMGMSQGELLGRMHGDALKVLCIVLPDVEEGTPSNTTNEGIRILSSNVKDLFLNGEKCDFTIKVGDKDFHVHKTILSARSPVLSAMLHHDMAEKSSGTTKIEDCEPDVFERFLLYLYSGEVEGISWEIATHLYTLGDKYDMPHLRKECLQFMEGNMCVDAFCDAVSLAVNHNVSTLVKCVEEFFVKNVDSILETTKWKLLLKEIPEFCNELYIKCIKNNATKK